jgi:hypothetical protein
MSVFPSVLAKSLPKKLPLVGAAGFAGSSFAVPSLENVVPSLNPPARPNKPCDAGACGVGVASSLFRSFVPLVSLISDDLDSKDEVLKEDLSCCPKIPLLCCAGVFPNEGSDDPVLEPTVTVEPKLGSLLRLANPDFCCPSAANPDDPDCVPNPDEPDCAPNAEPG